MFRAIRRQIDSSGSVKADTNSYTYSQIRVYDGEDDDVGAIVYKRYGKYMDIGGVERNAHGVRGGRKDNGGCVEIYNSSEYIADEVYSLLREMGLTDRQMTVIMYRLQGFGLKAIATKLGISPNGVKKNLMLIAKKADAIGLNLGTLDEDGRRKNNGK